MPPPSLDAEMMMLLQGRIAGAGHEGISIDALFDQLQNDPSAGSLDDARKNELWVGILERDDVLIGDSKCHALMVKKNMCLEDVYAFGLQEMKVRVKEPSGASFLPSVPTSDAATGGEDDAADEQGRASSIPLPATATPIISSPAADLGAGILDTTEARVPDSPLSKHSEISDTTSALPLSNHASQHQRKRKLPNSDGTTTKPGNNQKYLRHAIFTPQIELDRQEDDILRRAGVPRVYIDPYGSEYPRPNKQGRKPLRMVAVFKSDKLKNPQWLDFRAQSWIEPFNAKIGSPLPSMLPEELPPKRKRTHKHKSSPITDTPPSVSFIASTAPMSASSSTFVPLSDANFQHYISDHGQATQSKATHDEENGLLPQLSLSTYGPPSHPYQAKDLQLPPAAEHWQQSAEHVAPANSTQTRPSQPIPQNQYVQAQSILNHSSNLNNHPKVQVPNTQQSSAEQITLQDLNSSAAASETDHPSLPTTSTPKINNDLQTNSNFLPASSQSTSTQLSPNGVLLRQQQDYRRRYYGSAQYESIYGGSNSQTSSGEAATNYYSPYLTSSGLARNTTAPPTYSTPYSTLNSLASGTGGPRPYYSPYAPSNRPTVATTAISGSKPTTYHWQTFVMPDTHQNPSQPQEDYVRSPTAGQNYMLTQTTLQPQHSIAEADAQVAPSPNDRFGSIDIHHTSSPSAGLLTAPRVSLPPPLPFPPATEGPSIPKAPHSPMTTTSIQGEQLPPTKELLTSNAHKRKASVTASVPNKRLHTDPSLPSDDASLSSTLPKTLASVQSSPDTQAMTKFLEEREKKAREKQERDAELQSALRKADTVEITDMTARLSVQYQDLIGNLILSKDQTTLTFSGIEPSETPLLVIPISSFKKYPILSMKGSDPMELIVYGRDGEDVEIDHRFNIGLAAEAQVVANEMRSKLAMAMVIHAKGADGGKKSEAFLPNKAKEVFAFVCEKCKGRWKNREGLKYHLNSSNTSCNKNWDPSRVDLRKARKKKETSDKVETKIPPRQTIKLKATTPKNQSGSLEDGLEIITEQKEMAKGVDTGIYEKGLRQEADEPDTNYQSEASSESSVDSVLEWARKVSVPGPKMTSKRRRSSLPVDTEALQAIVDEAAGENELPDAVMNNSSLEADTDLHEITKSVILGLVKGNYGIFPGDRSLWYAVFAACVKKAAQLRTVITAEMCKNALSTLLLEGNLNSTTIHFTDKDSRTAQRTIITEPDVDLKSPVVEMLQEVIQEIYPEYYVPSKFAPENRHLAILRGIAKGGVSASLHAEEPFPKRRKRASNTPQKYRATSVSTGYELISEDEYMAEKILDERLDNTGSDISDLSQEITPGSVTSSREAQADVGSSKRVRVPLTAEQKEERANRAARRQQSWSQAPAYLQASETGAWSDIPERIQVVGSKAKARKTGPYCRRLPEPITYMQDPSGAWSIRPFGHGVKPIYARPSRMADGNPTQRNYLARRDNSFRPIIQPVGIRKFLPGPPSKRLLDPKKTTPRKSGTRRTYTPLSSASPEDPDFGPLKTKPASKPKRAYRRKASSVIGQSTMSVARDLTTAVSNTTPKRSTRTSRAARMDHIQQLNSFEPKEIISGVAKPINPGLDTLPSSFGLRRGEMLESVPFHDKDLSRITFDVHDILHDRFVNVAKGQSPQEIDILSDIEQTARWEQDVSQAFFAHGVVAPNHGWVNHTLTSFDTSFDTETTILKWRDDAAFTVETLPYERLVELDVPEYMEDLVDVPRLPSDISIKPEYQMNENDDLPTVNKPQSYRRKPQRQKTRYVTLLSSKFQEIADAEDPIAAGKEIGLQVVPVEAIARNRRRDNCMSMQDEMRLIVAVVAIRVLTGGLDQIIDWNLVATVFKSEGFTMTLLNKRWLSLHQKKKDSILKLTSIFQDSFLSAYKNGEVPTIDYENLPAYDWKTLVDWAMKALGISAVFEAKHFDLPSTRKSLGKQYECTEKEMNRNGRDRYYNPVESTWKRLHFVASIPNTLPAVSRPTHRSGDESSIDDFTLAKSLVRAAALTPADDYDLEIATEKLGVVDRTTLEEAIETLRKDKVIIKRRNATPGRQYEAAGAFSSTLQRKQVTADHVMQAVEFKRFLDEKFGKGQQCVRADYMTNNGTIMCVTQLQAHGRIRLQGVNIPMKKFGFTQDGSYDTSRIPRTEFNFEIDIYPTASYIYDTDITAVLDALDAEPPRGSPAGEIPAWYGITEQLIPHLWTKILVTFSGMIALRTGTSVASLVTTFKSTLEEWEIRRLLAWGVEIGLFKRLDGEVEGWTVTEWWWAIVGQFCEIYS